MQPKKTIKAVRKVVGRLEPFSPAEQQFILRWSAELLRVSGGVDADPSMDDLFVVLLAYLKDVQKEAREDRSSQQEEKKKAFAEKLKSLKEAIQEMEDQQTEWEEKFPE